MSVPHSKARELALQILLASQQGKEPWCGAAEEEAARTAYAQAQIWLATIHKLGPREER